MNTKTCRLLDAIPMEELEAYLKGRRRDDYLSEGAVDGWERTSGEIEMGEEGGDDFLVIDEGDWIWRDEEGRIRRTFGWSGGSHPRAHTFDEDGQIVMGWELRDAEDPEARSLDNLAAVRAEVMAADIVSASLTLTAAP